MPREGDKTTMAKTFVLLHGAWHGAWCWARVADPLRSRGHRVTTPTQTGLGERSHLISKDITLETFADDLINHIHHYRTRIHNNNTNPPTTKANKSTTE